ncbi:hypothetical protein FVEN_g12884 [Fusarium venenatum]|uniref:Uncharacterized protein n=1 Tax=Fusarium venenatum TaxID=56646 RepID=A0A2L2T784_9HYPO|nr:uncharacterized protein FVRRES_00175 [Fusarium venenatum]KAG8355446.1 hypothetical protein FVEN_g12884 [Fusarium venenatum]CEI63663.1 unnamed protein product [Fusarium venenatum]
MARELYILTNNLAHFKCCFHRLSRLVAALSPVDRKDSAKVSDQIDQSFDILSRIMLHARCYGTHGKGTSERLMLKTADF